MSFGSVLVETPLRIMRGVGLYALIVAATALAARWITPTSLSAKALYGAMLCGVLAHLAGTKAFRYIVSEDD